MGMGLEDYIRVSLNQNCNMISFLVYHVSVALAFTESGQGQRVVISKGRRDYRRRQNDAF